MDKIISLDGPSAAGKGAIAQEVAKTLKWHLLFSGLIYRKLALMAQRTNISSYDPAAVAELARDIPQQVLFLLNEGENEELNNESIGSLASILSTYPEVRAALLKPQRAFYRPPGLVAEGRDISSVVFPQAGLKIYLTADIRTRATRRLKQLSSAKHHAKIEKIIRQLEERDERDRNRVTAPLEKVRDAINMDSSHLSIPEVTGKIIALAKEKFNI